MSLYFTTNNNNVSSSIPQLNLSKTYNTTLQSSNPPTSFLNIPLTGSVSAVPTLCSGAFSLSLSQIDQFAMTVSKCSTIWFNIQLTFGGTVFNGFIVFQVNGSSSYSSSIIYPISQSFGFTSSNNYIYYIIEGNDQLIMHIDANNNLYISVNSYIGSADIAVSYVMML